MTRHVLCGLLLWLGLGCGDVHAVSLGSQMSLETEPHDAGDTADAQSQDAAKPAKDDADEGDDSDDGKGEQESGDKGKGNDT